MRLTCISTILAIAACCHAFVTRSELNGPCTGGDEVIGVCVHRDSCTSDNGTYIDNACPGTPEDIKCCTKPSCQLNAQSGDCRWVKDCGGDKPILQNLCPGPDLYRCCVTNEGNVSSSLLPTSLPSGLPTSSANSTTPITTLSTQTPILTSKKPTPTTKPKPRPTKTLGEKILAKAKEAKGIPYHWAGGNCAGPTGGGFDCSGLVSWAVCQMTGRDLFSEGLRVTRSMYCASEKTLKYKKVPWEERRAGDAVFFGRTAKGSCAEHCEGDREEIHHVGLMMGRGWTMWNALKTGTRVRVDDFEGWGDRPCEHVIRFE